MQPFIEFLYAVRVLTASAVVSACPTGWHCITQASTVAQQMGFSVEELDCEIQAVRMAAAPHGLTYRWAGCGIHQDQ